MSQIYLNTSGSGPQTVLKITGNTGSATPDGTGNINLVTANTNVKFVGAGSTITQDFAPASTNLLIGTSGPSTSAGSTSLGFQALSSLSSGISNTCGGHVSGNAISTGQFNTAWGEGSLFSTSSSINGTVALGWHALLGASSDFSIGIGYTAMSGGVSGANNLGIGEACFQAALSGQRNLGIGTNSGQGITSGSFNTFLGHFTGSNGLSTGTNNIFVGDRSGFSYTTSESSNILVGSEGTIADNNTVRIGNQGSGTGQQNLCFIAGITGASVTGAPVIVSATGQLGVTVSSKRYKENIDCIPPDVSILGLRPATFNYIKDENKSLQYGLIAEEVHEEVPYLCVYNDENQPETIKYHELPIFLLHEIQKLNKRIERLEIGE
jgi:hypothetical protein